MRNFVLLTSLLLAMPVSARAAMVGPDAAVCASGQPSIDVVVSGFKQASGTLKVTLYDSDPSRYLVSHGKLRNVIVPVHSIQPVEVCIAVPKPGLYAVALHHDLNGNDQKDRRDGAAYSRNPRLSIFNLKPPFSKTGIRVGDGPVRTGITLLYLNGLSIGPAKG